MARAEVTGKKPRVTDDRVRRRKGPPRVDPDAIEPTEHSGKSDDCTTTASPIHGPPIPPAVYTIASFCSAHHLSESMFFKIRETGIGPREMRVGARVFITFESAAAWRAEREAATAAAASTAAE